jgi:MFS family permease
MSGEQTAGIEAHQKRLFWGCFIALIATAFGFVVRSMVINDWGTEFGLTETQKGEIFGVGLWPFALSIILFSLVIDRIGYGRAMAFAFACHVISAVLTIFATGYWMLYIATFIVALGNGAVEAVINPVVATMFRNEKTKWLNILHAGWPGGMVIGGVMAIALGADADWQIKVGLILIPTAIYAVMLFGQKFPVHERVESGVSYLAMLKEVGIIGALIVVSLMTAEVGRVFSFPLVLELAIIVALTGVYGFYVKSLGKPLFIFMLLIMMPLATTELGTDSWITPLMEPEMNKLGFQPLWVLIYTSFIMMLLRFCAGSIVHKLSPLGLLAGSAVIAACGLVFLSQATGVVILAAATLYAFGKTFFWPTMLGVAAEQFPKGGALTLNTLGGVGMLAVGIVGAPFLGYIQDTSVATVLEKESPAIYQQYTSPKPTIFGQITALDPEKEKAAPEADTATITTVKTNATKGALKTVAIFPCIMFVCFIILIVYFKSKGGYKVAHIDH